LRSLLPTGQSQAPLVLLGHDRGARVVHRLQVSSVSGDSRVTSLGFNIIAIALLDIIPGPAQWATLNNPAAAAGVFHWPFLANVELAKAMITAYGGGKWAKEMILRWAGSNPEGLKQLKSGDALDVYGSFFERESVIDASNRDYEAGAGIDVARHIKDNAVGTKINVPVLLIYGEAFLGKRGNVPEIWKDWVADSAFITSHGLSNGIGHFVAEEAPEDTASALLDWLKTL
jgi:pimeloyl-ACP methyl ester carboxylesterase